MKDKVEDKILKLANKAADAKLKVERDKARARADADIEVIKSIVSMVKDGLVYKRVGRFDSKYVLVTEDMVLEDYTNPADSYSKETKIETLTMQYSCGPKYLRIKVSGHQYEHAKDIFNRFKFETEKAVELASQELDKARERQRLVKKLERQTPFIKEMMIRYQEYEAGQ